MAELSHNTKSFINGLSEAITHTYSTDMGYADNYSTNIINHNVFGKFLIIDIVGEKNFTLPSLYVREVLDDFISRGTRRFIRQLYKVSGYSSNGRSFTSVLKWMYNNHNSTEGCAQHYIKDSYYYTFGNILLDKDFNPLVIPCYEIEVLEDRRWNVKSVVYKISNSLYSSTTTGIDTAKKFITTKMIPYLAELGAIPHCSTQATYADYQYNIPIKIEIENLDRFICNPIEPSDNFQAEANAILSALVEDIVNTNM